MYFVWSFYVPNKVHSKKMCKSIEKTTLVKVLDSLPPKVKSCLQPLATARLLSSSRHASVRPFQPPPFTDNSNTAVAVGDLVSLYHQVMRRCHPPLSLTIESKGLEPWCHKKFVNEFWFFLATWQKMRLSAWEVEIKYLSGLNSTG
jgi:hypothetical protein